MKTALFACIVAVLPGLAIAECTYSSASMSCADGTVYDSEKAACVPVTG